MSELDFKGFAPNGPRIDPSATRSAPTSTRGKVEPVEASVEPASPEQASDPLDPEALEEVVERLAEAAHRRHPDLHFAIHEASGRMVVQVIDKSTGDVIRQIPSEEALRAAQRIAEQGGGALLEITV